MLIKPILQNLYTATAVTVLNSLSSLATAVEKRVTLFSILQMHSNCTRKHVAVFLVMFVVALLKFYCGNNYMKLKLQLLLYKLNHILTGKQLGIVKVTRVVFKFFNW